MEQIYDLIIIGSGPAGLGAAIYAKRAELKTLVIEKEMMSGGQVLTTYEVDNYAGLPGIGGFDLGMKFREHADKLGVEFAKDTVLKIEDADLADENEVLEAAEAGAEHAPVIRQVVGKKGDETRESGHYQLPVRITESLGSQARQNLPEKVFPTARPATARSSGKR
ncbi:MAG: NAD(P)/FAD-dependent oxidoreductase [Pilosibacter sp.]